MDQITKILDEYHNNAEKYSVNIVLNDEDFIRYKPIMRKNPNVCAFNCGRDFVFYRDCDENIDGIVRLWSDVDYFIQAVCKSERCHEVIMDTDSFLRGVENDVKGITQLVVPLANLPFYPKDFQRPRITVIKDVIE